MKLGLRIYFFGIKEETQHLAATLHENGKLAKVNIATSPPTDTDVLKRAFCPTFSCECD